jgi:hypothetical protein
MEVTLEALGIAVQCEGCGKYYLGGTDSPDDVTKDPTFREESLTFVCNTCYHDRGWFRKAVVAMVNSQFDYEMSVN